MQWVPETSYTMQQAGPKIVKDGDVVCRIWGFENIVWIIPRTSSTGSPANAPRGVFITERSGKTMGIS
jgi:hypothetical protein